VGTNVHCMHGKDAMIAELLDWRLIGVARSYCQHPSAQSAAALQTAL
jgi:hypothetical protein